MKIVIPGGSGQVGTILARAFHAAGDEVIVLSRNPIARPWRVVPWDGVRPGPWETEIEDADALVNLAGRSVNCRYTARHRREILRSRVESTRAVAGAIARSVRPPRAWLQASTATIYAHSYDRDNDERSGILGGSEPHAPRSWRFSIDVARAWERTLEETAAPRTRKIALRSAMVMSPDAGGVFDTLAGLVRRGVGGAAGDGRQFVSWIHDRDFVAAIRWVIDHQDIDGIVNVSSPHPLRNAAFMRLLRNACGVRFGLPAPRWMLEIGAMFMRTETELILKSRRVVPGRLLEHGFTFTFPDWHQAARDLCDRQQRLRTAP